MEKRKADHVANLGSQSAVCNYRRISRPARCSLGSTHILHLLICHSLSHMQSEDFLDQRQKYTCVIYDTLTHIRAYSTKFI